MERKSARDVELTEIPLELNRNRRLLNLHSNLPSILSRRSVNLSYRSTGEGSLLERLEDLVGMSTTEFLHEKREDLGPRYRWSIIYEGRESSAVGSREDLGLSSDLLSQFDVSERETRVSERAEPEEKRFRDSQTAVGFYQVRYTFGSSHVKVVKGFRSRLEVDFD